ncbi:hypothetical protein PLICRDRAFT_39502 [Plicaturopsis crispa FD-325 SS-3]|nr:hypothetical protein PLICRDRAFT_39502 [Plicaturopsis crispa FD-325 SS-3]
MSLTKSDIGSATPSMYTIQSVEMIELTAEQPPSTSPTLVPGTPTLELEAAFPASTDPDTSKNESSLAPVDRGFGALSFLAAAFFVEVIVWGFPNAFGVFLDSYLDDPFYASQKSASSLLPLIGPLSSGIMYCSSPVIYPTVARWPQYRQISMWIGALCCWGSLFGASYSTKVLDLVILQGVLYAVGGSLLYAPCISYLSEWFVERRGLASGVLFAGSASGGFILPLILPHLITTVGVAKTLRIISFVVLGLLAPLLPFVKGRLPASRIHGPAARASDRTWLRSQSFWLLIATNTLQSFGHFVPMNWLTAFAGDLHASKAKSSLTLSLLNGMSVLGGLSMGLLSDKFSAWLLALSTVLATSLITFVLWGVLSHSFAGLLLFSIVYGALAGGWASLWAGFVRPIAMDDPRLSTTLFGYLMLSRGLGNILSTPISTSLSRLKVWQALGLGYAVGGGRFENMIIYAGTCFAAAAIIASVGLGTEKHRPHSHSTAGL